ncbi:MAG: DUF4140 domain-containing protein, partial [Deltaproteobacteria bacterium]|nr:DUF4140 domain-containing protein [Deltaproteobacteria bacterium]
MSELEISARVVRVTVYEDRADVVREAEVELPAGAHTLVVRGVSPVVSDEHVVARLEARDGGALTGVHVNDARVERRIDTGAPTPTDAAARRAARQAELERLDDELAGARRLFERHGQAMAEAELSAQRFAEAAARAAGRGEPAVAAASAALAAARTRMEQVVQARHAARSQLVELERRRARAAADERPAAVEPKVAASLRIAVGGSGGPVKLVVS